MPKMFMKIQNEADLRMNTALRHVPSTPVPVPSTPRVRVDLKSSMISRILNVKSGCGSCGK
jgi:hypothetical protein